jgi:hypothetical protein
MIYLNNTIYTLRSRQLFENSSSDHLAIGSSRSFIRTGRNSAPMLQRHVGYGL